MKNGQIFYQVLEAKGLGLKDLNPYVKVYLDKSRLLKTVIIKKTVEPKWDETARLEQLAGKTYKLLKFKVSSDRFLIDQTLGAVSFNVEDLYDGVPRDQWFVVKKGSKEHGEVHLRVLYLEQHDTLTPQLDEFPYPLQTLMRKGKKEPFKKCLESTDRKEVTDREGNRPLHVASALDNLEFLNQLLEAGCDIEGPGGDAANGARPLHAAAKHSSTCVSRLIEKGAEINSKDKTGQTPLFYAAVANHADNVKLLVEKGAEVNAVDDDGETALHKTLHVKKGAAGAGMKALMESGASLFVKNKSGITPATLCCDIKVIDEKTKEAFLEAVGIVDDREFELIERFSKEHRQIHSGQNLGIDWTKNPQFRVTAAPGTKAQLLLFYKVEEKSAKPMEKLGFTVVSTTDGEHNETTYQQNNLGFGTSAPFDLTFEEGKLNAVIPFAKVAISGDFSIITYSDAPVEIHELKPWKHKVAVEGEWKGSAAGGCKTHDTFLDNPRFKLEVPKDAGTLNILLTQERMALDMAPGVMPYKFFIGFYILKPDLKTFVAETDKWKNARETFARVKLDAGEYVLVATTFKPGEETSFTISVCSDVEGVKLSPISQ